MQSSVIAALLALGQGAAPLRPAAPPATGCVPADSTAVALAGRLVRRTYAGPPNYSDTARGDSIERGWYLELAAPVCLPGTDTTRVVQLIVPPEMYRRHGAWVGQRVVATGALLSAETGHHHTPVLLAVRELRLSSSAR